MRDDHFPTMGYWARVTLTVTAIVALLVAAWTVRSILLLVLVSTVLAVGLDPQVRWLQRRSDRPANRRRDQGGDPRTLAEGGRIDLRARPVGDRASRVNFASDTA